MYNMNYNVESTSTILFPPPPVEHRHVYYNLPQSRSTECNEPQFHCKTCNKQYYSHFQLHKHCSQHIKCPFPECNFNAVEKVMDQHISHQHLMVNFGDLQVDDETWIKARKQRFPTSQRAELRHKQQLLKIKRGERLDLNKTNKHCYKSKREKKFQKNKNFNDDENNKKETIKPNKRSYNICKTRIRSREDELYESDEGEKYGIKSFKGVQEFLSDDSSDEELQKGSTVKTINDKESEEKRIVNNADGISDEEDEWTGPQLLSKQKLQLSNALGSLMGAYGESESEEEKLLDPLPKLNNDTSIISYNTKLPSELSGNTLKAAQQNNDQGTTNHITISEETNTATGQNSSTTKANPLDAAVCTHLRAANGNKSNKNVRKYSSQGSRSAKCRKTLLERLLLPDIKHERNEILQCVKFVVDNNFFDK